MPEATESREIVVFTDPQDQNQDIVLSPLQQLDYWLADSNALLQLRLGREETLRMIMEKIKEGNAMMNIFKLNIGRLLHEVKALDLWDDGTPEHPRTYQSYKDWCEGSEMGPYNHNQLEEWRKFYELVARCANSGISTMHILEKSTSLSPVKMRETQKLIESCNTSIGRIKSNKRRLPPEEQRKEIEDLRQEVESEMIALLEETETHLNKPSVQRLQEANAMEPYKLLCYGKRYEGDEIVCEVRFSRKRKDWPALIAAKVNVTLRLPNDPDYLSPKEAFERLAEENLFYESTVIIEVDNDLP